MRIAQLANFVGPTSGGMKTAVAALGAGYTAAGTERLLVVPGPRDARASTSDGEVVTLRAPRVGGGYRLLVEPWRVVDVLKAFRPTSVEVSDKSTLLPVTRWARRTGVAAVLFSHERLDAMLSLRTGFQTGINVSVSVLNRLLVRQYDAIVVTSRFALGEFAALAAAGGTAIHQVPLGVDLDTFRPRPSTRPSSGNPIGLVHAGRLSREKSPHLAVQVAVELHRRGVPVRMDVYGDGPHRAELGALAEGAPIRFRGHVADRVRLSEALGRADVALSVCPGETFGLAVLEALASGTPVVTADSGGARELVQPDCGAWAAPEPEPLAEAVLRLLQAPRPELRAASRRRAEQFGWDRTVAAMIGIHAEVLEAGAGRRAASSA